MAKDNQRRISVFLDASIKNFVKGFKRAQGIVRDFGSKIRSHSSRIRRAFSSWGDVAARMGNKFHTVFNKIGAGIKKVAG